ncbi:MAG: tetrahydromethanopterin S-methyltransferase subunit H [Nitrososphaerota archaeon]|nr:tetrahydromethanopterin S-methyltransferase subunit H [Candidatus Bathyarchaeota archaeon]MCX8161469.1 tetrahydromethanopterin S-methyltransferase subunit H [Candidatus Bathyarchaeota archaeon]MDW8061700.1 tetrahydromethanopterin S-methyltransferase subunit H [Nitrososphaerota archaeon]
MWRLSCEQKIFDIFGVKVGGQPGLRPVVLIGSIFYHKHSIVTDESKGLFKEDEAKRLLDTQLELSQRTGNPCMVDIVASTPEAMRRYLEYVSDKTSIPILLGGVTDKVRMAGLDYVGETGIADRIVYNSVNPHSRDDELRAIARVGVSAAVLLTFGSGIIGWKHRVEAAERSIERLRGWGIDKVLIDTGVLDIPSLGSASMALWSIKDRIGYPSGCGAHNAIASWRSLRRSMGREVRDVCGISASILAVAAGADFILYGPIEYAKLIFPAVAMADAALSQVKMEDGFKIDRLHPRYKIGRI